MILQTDLKHIETEEDFKKVIEGNENVMICCGRMGPMCVPVFGAMNELEKSDKYNHIAFRDMHFDNPHAHVIRNLPECQNFMGLPFTVYFKHGKVVEATSSIQSKEQVEEILQKHYQ